MNIQSIALVLSLIDLGFPSALVGAVEDHRTAAPTFACSVGLSEDKVVIALLDIVLGMSRCMTLPYLYFALDLFSRVGPDNRDARGKCTGHRNSPHRHYIRIPRHHLGRCS
jgi:hypothetical protein